MRRTATKSEKDYMKKVAGLSCIVCRHCYGTPETPAVVHHVRALHGWGRSSHMMTLPLCPEHHTGDTGVHAMGRAEFEHMHGYSEIDLLAVLHSEMGL